MIATSRLLLATGVLSTLAAMLPQLSAEDQKKDEGKAPAAAAPAARQGQPPIVSPQVSSDRKVTFRISAPNAKEVSVTGEIPGSPVKLSKDEQGLWSATTGPLPPELYGYTFVVDGLRLPDPANANIKPMRSPTTSILDIPGEPPLMHDYQKVPHGTVRVHHYPSKATASLRRMHIYTPPGYDKDASARFPTLYLFHGSGDNDACWTVLGRANWILDNLIAQGKAVPMVVVMTDGHASSPASPQFAATDGTNRRNAVFQQDLLEEVIPFVEANYRVKADRANRGIIGLSMGGGQSLSIGLNHLDLFAYVGGMSSSLRDPEATVPGLLADPNGANDKLKLLWIACGRDDRLVEGARTLSTLLKSKGIRHEYIESDGGHSWPVWRKYLAQFAPKVFVEPH